jgi:hypothetical protein
MQADPIYEWQRLSEHYREMSDGELRELAADFADLTGTAQQALHSEMQNRGLGDPAATEEPWAAHPSQEDVIAAPSAPNPFPEQAAVGLDVESGIPELAPDTPGPSDDDASPHEYTWKTILCECDTPEEAWQLFEALKQAGIPSWIEGPKPRSGYTSFDLPNPRVLVAADQIDQARVIAARPIPPEIVEESETKVPDFTPPSCPRCGAGDPVLEGVDPSNTWRCEQCGEQWTESAPRAEEAAPNPSQTPL